MSRRRPLEIAIVGLACRFPGARTAADFWDNTLAARDCIREVPRERWDPEDFFDPAANRNDRVYCKRGGYLDAPIEFDPVAHGIMPLAVAGGEPEQFLVLDAVHAALADAGMSEGLAREQRVEVVIGRGNYFNRGNLTRLQHGRITAQTLEILRQLHPEWTVADLEAVRADLKASLPPFEPGTIAAQVTNSTAGRVANRLDLSGASFVVDAASASSLVALDLGARALVERRADLALVGGVYLQPDVDFPMVFCQLGALSRQGEARPFAQDADGTLPGEGVGVLVLKRAREAERDGDRIYAVLKGVGLASDGRGTSLAAPSARGHARAMRRAYRQAGIDPASVGFVEGHGLGVPASDHAELRALRAVYARKGPGTGTLDAKCALGAATALIGHAMPAAGTAGLIKAALALHHRVIPPTPHADRPHPLLADADSPFELPAAARPWIHGGRTTPRRAAVNAFGFAGINAHAVLEEHPGSADAVTPGCQMRWDTEAILLSGPDRGGLVRRIEGLIAWLEHEPNQEVNLKDLAFTLNNEPPAGPSRLGLVVESAADLLEKLRTALARLGDPRCQAIRDGLGAYFWEQPLGGKGRVAFVFAGEGAQYPGMLGELCRHFPEVRAWFDTSDRVAREQGHRRVPSELLYNTRAAGEVDLWSIGTAVNAVLSAHWGLRTLLAGLAIRPDRVLGHSSGEILALAAAGVIKIDSAFSDRMAELGTIFERLEESGQVPRAALMAVAADRQRIEPLCREIDSRLEIALDNCPHQVIVSGPEAAADRLLTRLRAQGVMCEALPFARAYHTAAFETAMEPIRTFFDELPLELPSVPIDSCAIGGAMPADIAEIRRLAVEQWARPVAFRATIEAMYEAGARIFIEVGARGNLTGFIEDTLRGRPHFAVAPCLPRRGGLTQLNHMVAGLFAQGVTLRPDALYARRRPVELDLMRPLMRTKSPSLAVGFPAMRLSPELAERLRAGDAKRPQSGHETRPLNGHNGHGHPEHAPSPAPEPVVTADPRSALFRAHLRTMDEFLETQKQIMETYLAARRGQAPRPTHRAMAAFDHLASSAHAQSHRNGTSTVPAAPRETERRRPQAKAARTTEPAPAPAAVPARRSPEEILLDQVSRRTGYPQGMLKLDFDMEGDLGIDSIKRVEIFGELQAAGVVPERVDIDRLSGCRTLGQVLELLAPGESASPPSPADHGPWVGTIESLDPGRALVAVRRLDLEKDPVARQHTLGGRRVSALDPSQLGLPVVPFTVMTEMLAQAAAVLAPGQVVVGLRDVQAHRWIRYEEKPVALEIRAVRDPERSDEIRVAIYNRGTYDAWRQGREQARAPENGLASGHGKGAGGNGAIDVAVVEGRVVVGCERPSAPVAPTWNLDQPRTCRFTAEMIYRDQWLFHGPALQAVVGIGRIAPRGIEGTLRVLPRAGLFPPGASSALVTDPIVLDAYTHLLGCWGLDQFGDNEGDVIFPLRLAELTFFDNDPGEGADTACRIQVREIERHRVRVDADIVAPDGRVWMRLTGWNDWRFYWPGRYRDHMRMPDRVTVSEPLELPHRRSNGDSPVQAVWLEPPADFGKPVWRDVLEALDLAPEERAACRALPGPESRATLRLWGRVAAKDAVRRLWTAEGKPPVYPADLKIEPDPNGRPWLRSLLEPGRTDLPAISIAHTRGVAVALAAADPDARLGIDVEPVTDRSPEFERLAFDDAERTWLDRMVAAAAGRDAARAEWIARLWCAKEAVAKGTGLGMLGGPGAVKVVAADAASGAVAIALGPELAARTGELGRHPLRAVTARRGDHVWAWTLAERMD